MFTYMFCLLRSDQARLELQRPDVGGLNGPACCSLRPMAACLVGS